MILDDILAHTRETVAAARRAVAPSDLRELPRWHEPRRGFRGALAAASAPAVVAEIKRASPSRGLIRADAFDPAAHARSYAGAGATAISVLTERRWFGGALEHLGAARDAVRLPLLRKDFLLDPYQVEEARAWGADAVLVIVAAVDEVLGAELLAAARAHGLDALVEVHDRRELDAALGLGATLVGVNNRDLRTFETRLDTTEELAPLVPPGVLLVAESGIHRPADVRRMCVAGAHAVLVGEAFMAAPDPGAALRELLAWR
jgi:indole-3-glycerol phosphate synthase